MTNQETAPPLPGADYAGESAAVLDAAEDIGTYLALWSVRYRGEPDAHGRQAANDAMSAIDRALAGLHALRSRLVADIRASDGAAWSVNGDETRWTSFLPDGRMAVAEVLDDGESFLPRISAFGKTGEEAAGPVFASLVAAVSWCEEYAAVNA